MMAEAREDELELEVCKWGSGKGRAARPRVLHTAVALLSSSSSRAGDRQRRPKLGKTSSNSQQMDRVQVGLRGQGPGGRRARQS
jgi:hypothetical protein